MGDALFVKPCREGSSLGVSKVRTAEEYSEALGEAFAADRKVLVEEAISGREIECSVLGMILLRQLLFGGKLTFNEFYSYEAKYVDEDGADLIVPAEIDLDVSRKIRQTAVEAFRSLNAVEWLELIFF
ncbi:MAG: hypothetical protein Ct9H300mP28_07950 [Pseudomonadota bacterium]|nr:MAG: hypothetical protein Ct9H300mP28_07950 [Pseudomonadota bacterium]